MDRKPMIVKMDNKNKEKFKKLLCQDIRDMLKWAEEKYRVTSQLYIDINYYRWNLIFVLESNDPRLDFVKKRFLDFDADYLHPKNKKK